MAAAARQSEQGKGRRYRVKHINVEEKSDGRMGSAVRKMFSGKQNIWKLMMVALLIAQVLLVLYYGSQKAGFHEDEFYSYYSTNRTAGLYEPDREWVDRDTLRKEFVVLEGERFRYGLVALVQSWDVHPPFFYFLLHTASSFFPGVFSKWIGIGVNLIAYIGNFLLLAWLSYMVTDKNKRLTLVVSAVNGFNAVIISGVLFIRMYEWLTFFILCCACLHIRAIKKGDLRFRTFFLPLMAVTYLGFLTQYYYIIFLFFMAVGFEVWLFFRDRKPGCCIRYGLSCAAALLLAVLCYPASVSHIFRGYRGTGAVSEFLDAENTGERFRFFSGLMNDYVFDGLLWLWLAAAAVMAVWLLIVYRRKLKEEAGSRREETDRGQGLSACLLLVFTVYGYFFTVSKTALLLFETSNRYQLPIYGIVLLLVLTALYTLGKKLLLHYHCGKRIRSLLFFVLFAAFLAADIHGLAAQRVLFLYKEEKERMEYARENAQTPVVILYNDATPYHVWWCSDELMEYESVYFASEGNQERITDETVCSGRKLIVYAADGDAKDTQLQMLLDGNPNLSAYRLVSQKDLWNVYEFE